MDDETVDVVGEIMDEGVPDMQVDVPEPKIDTGELTPSAADGGMTDTDPATGTLSGTVRESTKHTAKSRKASASKPRARPKPKGNKASAKPAAKARLAQLKAEPSGGPRGRSISETPAPSQDDAIPASDDGLVLEEEIEEDPEPDTKLYCICETLYNEERIMVACDKCDEWYHPSCVHLDEKNVELVDKFFCPRCVAIEPQLVTSYKPVCARPDCTHPARPPLSRYCSTKCGIRAVMARVDEWGGDADRLLEHPAVANARQPEGLLVIPPDAKHLIDTNEDLRRQLDRLQRGLKKITHDRERQLSLDSSLQARMVLLQSSTVRIQQKGEASCGFDARLVFDEETWQQWLEQGGKDFLYERQGGGLDEDPDDDEKWYCARARKCDRHAGYVL
ncbi:hypothetical protein BS47DRAFT_1047589 [Hydnum rufescens UP504]|uniref:PHD-type domain-containing protein n=1 Tax=Hydnum rufescens UP504 TaxID=1448309 RepID=A0A9P6AVB0_9AGAM|nr:hypothetical protein BS47DRAFT_1047589 [Hydnum rufescens UP504]